MRSVREPVYSTKKTFVFLFSHFHLHGVCLVLLFFLLFVFPVVADCRPTLLFKEGGFNLTFPSHKWTNENNRTETRVQFIA